MAFTNIAYKKLVQALITNVQTTIFTVPAASQDIVKGIDIANNSNAAVNVSVDLVPSGGSVGNTTKLFPQVSVAAFSTLHWTGTQVLNVGDFISVVASVTNVCSINVSGLEAT